MNGFLVLPLHLRLVLLALAGAAVGSLVNWAVYRLAWRQRWISPWTTPPSGIPPRRCSDCLPIVGWWLLRRESPRHGAGFWIRPLAVEVILAAMAVIVYLWATDPNGLLPLAMINAVPPPALQFVNDDVTSVLHVQYLSHMILLALMLVASLIDIDEKTIPDGITVWGTLAGLILAAIAPWSLPISALWRVPPNGAIGLEFLTLTSPQPFPDTLAGLPLLAGLAIGLGCWTLWCGGLMPRRWNTRHGLSTAVRVFFHRLLAERFTYRVLLLWLLGTVAIGLAASRAEPAHWAGLLSALVGMAGGGGMIWAVRIVGRAALGREAMGFGDVTLMSMIGTFVGWQGSLMIFFLAPFAALVIALAQLILHNEHEIPYGPFLCLGTSAAILGWPDVWVGVHHVFELGWLIPGLLAMCMVLMFLLLFAYRSLRTLLG